MRHTRSGVSRILLVAAMATCGAGMADPLCAETQGSASDPVVKERLNRAASDLFTRPERLEQVIDELKAILSLDVRSAEAHLLLGVAYGRLGSHELTAEAVAEFRQALALNPELLQARYYLAEAYLVLGRADRAGDEIRHALESAPGHPQLLTILAEAERQLEHPERSLEVSRQALEADESFVQARYYMSLSLLDLGRVDEAIEELERVVKEGSGVPDVYLHLGTAYLETERLDEALKTLGEGVAMDPSRPDIRIALARAQRSAGLLDAAAEQLALALPAGTTMAASSLYEEKRADLYVELGLIAIERRQIEHAVEAFAKALEISPTPGPIHRHLAEAYLLQNRPLEAVGHAKEADRLGFPLSDDTRMDLKDQLRQSRRDRRR